MQPLRGRKLPSVPPPRVSAPAATLGGLRYATPSGDVPFGRSPERNSFLTQYRYTESSEFLRSVRMPPLTSPVRLIRERVHVHRITTTVPSAVPRRAHKVIAVMPAYNAEKTLASTLADMPA